MVRSWPDLRQLPTAELIEFLALAASVWLCMVRARRCPRSARLSEFTVKRTSINYHLSSINDNKVSLEQKGFSGSADQRMLTR
jgi:hypothetical protein